MSTSAKGSNKRSTVPKGAPKGLSPASRIKPLDIDEFILSVASRSQSLVADRVREMVRRKDYKGLTALKISAADYTSYADFAPDYLLCNLVKKYRGYRLDVDRELAAFEKWLAAEESCRTTNHFLRVLHEGGFPFPPRVTRMLYTARRKVGEILGSFDWEFVRDNCRFGPGSDTSTRGDFTSSYNKYKSPGSATPWVLPLFAALFQGDVREDYSEECKLVEGNRLAFVPKTALIDRAICTEPRWNVFVQLGIGELMAVRLKANAGIDLKSQDRNRYLAERAQCRGLATLDLSSASDTVSKGLVLFLIDDEDWRDAIFKSRSPRTLYRGKWYQLEKVSSMGNGYTFPLESLIFYSLAYAAMHELGMSGEIGVFGDDIIINADAAPTLIELLSYAGFSTNVDKSFINGRFFESCGKDYFDSVDVRPFFLKEKVSSVLDYYVLANQVSEYARRLPDVSRTLGLRDLWLRIVDQIPKRARLYGPVGLSGVIHAPWDVYGSSTRRPTGDQEGWEGVTLEAWTVTAVKHYGNSYRGHLFTKLHQDVDSQNGFTTRGAIRWKRKRVIVPTIADFCWE